MTAIPCCYFRLSPVAEMFAISDNDIAVGALREQLMDPGAGGLCVFEGWVRNENEGRTVERLEYEVYEPLAVSEGEKVIAEAKELEAAGSAATAGAGNGNRASRFGVAALSVLIFFALSTRISNQRYASPRRPVDRLGLQPF